MSSGTTGAWLSTKVFTRIANSKGFTKNSTYLFKKMFRSGFGAAFLQIFVPVKFLLSETCR